MKVVIFAGGKGTRISEESHLKPKPMIEVGGKPILWHIMKIYAGYGVKEFVILTGYKSSVIKNYFANYSVLNNDFKVELESGKITFLNPENEDWDVTVLDTGLDNLKGSRIKQAEPYLEDGLHFITYGDGVADVNMDDLLAFHKSHGKLITLTGVKPPSRFGELNYSGNQLTSFEEKPQISSSGYINGGFMVFDKKMLSHLSLDKECDFEFGALEQLAREGEVMVYEHNGFWECVDTDRDLNYLNKLWNSGEAQWIRGNQ